MKTKEQPKGEIVEHDLPQDVANQTNPVDESRRRFTKSGVAVSGVLLTLASRPSLGGGGGLIGGNTCQSPSGFISGNLSHHGTHQGGGGQTCQHWITNCNSWVNCDKSRSFCTEFNFSPNGGSSYGCNVVYNFPKSGPQYGSYGSSGSQGTTYSKLSQGTYVQYTLLDILCRYHAGHKPTGTNSPCDIQKDSHGNIINTFYTTGQCSNITTYRPITENSYMDQLAQYCVAAKLNCRAGYTPFLQESTVNDMFNSCRTKGYFNPTAGVQWTTAQCVDYLKSTQNCTYYY